MDSTNCDIPILNLCDPITELRDIIISEMGDIPVSELYDILISEPTVIPIETKICTKCETEKPLIEFANNKCSTATHDSNGNRLIRPECKDCTKRETNDRKTAYNKAGKPEYPPAGTGCDICGKPGTSRFPILRFDHDHESLAHRGWLCDKCNRSLGCLGDDVHSIVKVLNYLNKSEKKTLVVEDGQVKVV